MFEVELNVQIDIAKIRHTYQTITYQEFRSIVKQKYFECIYKNQKTIFTYLSKGDISKLQWKNVNICIITKEEFCQLLIDLFEEFIEDYCKYTRERNGDRSVKTLNFNLIKVCVVLFAIVSVFLVLYEPTRKFVVLSIISYYSLCLLVKVVFLLIGVLMHFLDNDDGKAMHYNKDNNALPRYAILVPMFKEYKNTILQIVQNIDTLEYPKDKIDVFFVLEEKDITTKQIFQEL